MSTCVKYIIQSIPLVIESVCSLNCACIITVVPTYFLNNLATDTENISLVRVDLEGLLSRLCCEATIQQGLHCLLGALLPGHKTKASIMVEHLTHSFVAGLCPTELLGDNCILGGGVGHDHRLELLQPCPQKVPIQLCVSRALHHCIQCHGCFNHCSLSSSGSGSGTCSNSCHCFWSLLCRQVYQA
jgi:hypothetical protein